jgi:arylsulfatase A-like enzyme
MNIRLLSFALVLVWSALPLKAPAAEAPPNVILILIDDMGATDLGCTGSKTYQTPNIDRLAADGMRFNVAYSACTVCSPTRASLLTGRNPAQLHVTDWIKGHVRPKAKLRVPDWTMELPEAEITLAETLKAKGYATASIGKWHLGPKMPEQHGFDVNVAGTQRGQPPSYFSPYNIPTLPEGPDGEFLSDRLTAEAEKFIEVNRDKPFFVYLPHFAVHTPLQGKKDVIARYKEKIKPGDPHSNAVYAALVESVDDSVGRLRQKVESLGIANRTVIIFTSDNGGLIGGPKNAITSNLGLRAGKGSAYEGGVRVPLIFNWPGVVKAGSVVESPVITGDLFATVAELAGAEARASDEYQSLVPVLRGTGAVKERPFYWHYPHYHPGGATPYAAIRDGDYRLVHFYEDGREELYNLRSDPEEQQNLASTQPDRVTKLSAQLSDWQKKVGAQMPVPNPNFQPSSSSEQ